MQAARLRLGAGTLGPGVVTLQQAQTMPFARAVRSTVCSSSQGAGFFGSGMVALQQAAAFRAAALRRLDVCSASQAGSASQATASPQPKPKIIGRDAERGWFDQQLKSNPAAVWVVPGESSCGKTTFFTSFCQDTPHPTVFISNRKTNTANPEVLVGVLLQQCKEFCKKLGFKAVLDKIKDFVPAKVGVSFQGTGVTLDRATANNTIEDALAILLEALETYQKLKGPDAPKPVLIFDEAQTWRHWPEDCIKARAFLLNFLVEVSKVARLAHVYLPTSEYALVEFLQDELSDKNVRVLVFGNLNRANATLYIEHMAEQKGIPLPTTPDERTELMERIYQVCGGNPGLMNHWAQSYSTCGDWDSALDDVLAGSKPKINAALGIGVIAVGRDLGFTPVQFAKIAQLLIKEDGIIDMKTAVQLVGQAPFAAMVRGNLLSVRLYSSIAQDIPADRHMIVTGRRTQREPVVVPADSSFLCNLKSEKELIAQLAASNE